MIIGVTGPLCAGKDIIARIFEEKGFACFSFGDILRKDMKEKGIKLERREIQNYARDMRKNQGEGFIANLIIDKLGNRNCLVQGFRNVEEIKEFRKRNDFTLIALDASPEKRFERMKSRNRENDPRTFEEFKKLDEMELNGKNAKGYGFGIKACMDEADFIIENNQGLKELKEKVDKLLAFIRQKSY